MSYVGSSISAEVQGYWLFLVPITIPLVSATQDFTADDHDAANNYYFMMLNVAFLSIKKYSIFWLP